MKQVTVTMRQHDGGVEAILTIGSEPVSTAYAPTVAATWELIKEAVDSWLPSVTKS